MSAKENLDKTIKKYTSSWFDGLKKSWKEHGEKESLNESYRVVAELAVKAYLEDKIELKNAHIEYADDHEPDYSVSGIVSKCLISDEDYSDIIHIK